MLPGYTTNVAALRPLLQLTDAILLKSKEVGAHLRYSEEALSLMRRQNKGPPWIKLPTGGVRYRMSEVLAWELNNEAGPLTLDRVTLALLSCAEVPIEHRAALANHVQKALRTKGDDARGGAGSIAPKVEQLNHAQMALKRAAAEMDSAKARLDKAEADVRETITAPQPTVKRRGRKGRLEQ